MVSCCKEPSTWPFPFCFLFSCGTLHLCVCEFKLLYRRGFFALQVVGVAGKVAVGTLLPLTYENAKKRWFKMSSKEKNLGENQTVGHKYHWPCFSWCVSLLWPPQRWLCWTPAPLLSFALSSLFIRLSMGFVKTVSSKSCQNQWKCFWHSLETKGSLFSFLCFFSTKGQPFPQQEEMFSVRFTNSCYTLYVLFSFKSSLNNISRNLPSHVVPGKCCISYLSCSFSCIFLPNLV